MFKLPHLENIPRLIYCAPNSTFSAIALRYNFEYGCQMPAALPSFFLKNCSGAKNVKGIKMISITVQRADLSCALAVLGRCKHAYIQSNREQSTLL